MGLKHWRRGGEKLDTKQRAQRGPLPGATAQCCEDNTPMARARGGLSLSHACRRVPPLRQRCGRGAEAPDGGGGGGGRQGEGARRAASARASAGHSESRSAARPQAELQSPRRARARHRAAAVPNRKTLRQPPGAEGGGRRERETAMLRRPAQLPHPPSALEPALEQKENQKENALTENRTRVEARLLIPL